MTKNQIFKLKNSNKKAFFSKLELEKIDETTIKLDDNFSNSEIEEIIVKWISTGSKENRFTDDIPSSELIIN
jgi:hypothetical protein